MWGVLLLSYLICTFAMGGTSILYFSDEDTEAQISNINFKNLGWGGKLFL